MKNALRVGVTVAISLLAGLPLPAAAVGDRGSVVEPVGQLSISSVATNYVGRSVTFVTTITNIGTITLSSFRASEIKPPGLVGDAAETGDPYVFAITDPIGELEGGQPIEPLEPGQSHSFERWFDVEGYPGEVLTHHITAFAAEQTADPVVANPCPNDSISACASITIPPPTVPVGVRVGVCILPRVALCDPLVDSLWAGYGDVGIAPVVLPAGVAVYRLTVSNSNDVVLTGVKVDLFRLGDQTAIGPPVSTSQGDSSMFPGIENVGVFDTFQMDFPAWEAGTLFPGDEATLVFRTRLPIARGDTSFVVRAVSDTPEGFSPSFAAGSVYVTVGTREQFVRSLWHRVQSSAIVRSYLRAL